MPNSRLALIEEFFLSYRTNGQLLLKLLQAEFETKGHIHFSGFIVLKVLKKSGSLSQRAIANKLCHSEAAISRQVTLLQEKGMIQIEEDPNNRRALIISLTTKGRELVDSMSQQTISYISQMLNELNEDEIKTVIRINQKIQTMINKQVKKEANAS